jgi:hypothetical protein
MHIAQVLASRITVHYRYFPNGVRTPLRNNICPDFLLKKKDGMQAIILVSSLLCWPAAQNRLTQLLSQAAGWSNVPTIHCR